MSWIYWAIGGMVLLFIGVMCLALLSAGERLPPDVEAALIQEEQQRREAKKRLKELRKQERQKGGEWW